MFHIPEPIAEEAVPTLGHRDRQFRGIFSGLLPITIGVILFIGCTYFVLDRWHSGRVETCQNALYFYPNATILSRVDTPLTQPFGIIETRMEMTSPDDAATVESWYSHAWGAYVRAQVVNHDQVFSIPARGWQVEPAPNGNGSLIHFTGYCP